MKERLLLFTFFGILLAFAVNLAIDKIHAWLLPDSLWFQAHWALSFIALPAALLLGLAWGMGFFRKKGERWADAVACALTAAMIYLTLGAGYSCWHYCF